MKSKISNRTFVLHFITILFVALVYIAYVFNFFGSLQERLTDHFYIAGDTSDKILIVDIDEASLAVLGQWPWTREKHGILLERLEGAEVVGFDVIFSELSRIGIEDDFSFSEAIKGFGGRVVLPEMISEQTGVVKSPISVLQEVSEQGFVNTSPDRDGVVRFGEINRNEKPGFDLMVSGISFCDNKSTICSRDTIRIPYNGPARTYNTVSYVDVYNGNIPQSVFEDKIILVGASASGLGDLYQTPFASMPGVEIHANIIEALLENKFISEVNYLVTLVIMALIGFLALMIIKKVRSIFYLFGAIVSLFVFIILGTYIAFAFSIIIPHLYLLMLLLLVSGSLLLVQYFYEAEEKKFIRNGFEHYVAPEVVKELYDDPQKLSLGGESRELSILFSDIRGFTSISEKLTPQELMNQLNEYLEEMAEDVIKHKGLVDKYIGDAVMAFWGAPVENKKHPRDACRSAISMITSLKEINKKWTIESKPLFKIGIGISTGEVVVGNMGSKRRFNYSIIGDEVNFAARIEGLTKQYGVECIIGSETYKAIKDDPEFVVRDLDEVVVKGKKEPRLIYELLTEVVSEEKQSCLKYFREARLRYIAGEFDLAIKGFKKSLEIDPRDGPSQVFLDRSIFLKQNPPKDWSGVFEFTSK